MGDFFVRNFAPISRPQWILNTYNGPKKTHIKTKVCQLIYLSMNWLWLSVLKVSLLKVILKIWLLLMLEILLQKPVITSFYKFICKTEINKSCMSVCNCQKFQTETEKWKVCLIVTFVSVLKCPRMDRLLIFGVGICSNWFWQTNIISYHSSNPFIYFARCSTLKKIEKVNRYEFEIKEASSKSVS